MIRPWQEVTYGFFKKEILSRFWGMDPAFLGYVLEIQQPGALHDGVPCRFYLGNKIRPEDFPEWNKNILDVLKTFDTMDIKRRVGFCDVIESVRVSPLAVPSHYDLLVAMCFEDRNVSEDIKEKLSRTNLSLPVTYYKDSGKYLVNSSPEIPLAGRTRYVRVRIMDFSDWKSMVDVYLENGYKFPEEHTKDDYNKKDIIIYG